jgi:AsmA protein
VARRRHQLGRLTLSEPGGKEGFLALDAARVAVAVMPLLSKQVQVQRIEVDGLKATLVKRKDGTLNIADLMGGGDKPGAGKAGESGAGDGGPVQLDIAGIKMANAQFTWRDEKAGSTTALSNLDLGTGRVQADSGQAHAGSRPCRSPRKARPAPTAFELKFDAPRLASCRRTSPRAKR